MKTKLLIGIASLLVAFDANAGSNTLLVTDVNPVFKTVTRYQDVPYTETVCYTMRRNSRGALEKVIDNGFGSTGGLVGAGVGVAIADKLDGNDAAKVVAGLIGNKIGNDIAEKNSKERTCEEVTQYRRERYNEQLIDGYNITGNVGDSNGPIATVKRSFQPQIGDVIQVNMQIW
jgi:uncharacterized protein YcfJ